MKRYAFLCGSAPENYRQAKLEDMRIFLESEEGGAWKASDIAEFPNGVNELLLEYALQNCVSGGTEYVLLYICTESPVKSADTTIFLGTNEIRKDVLAFYKEKYPKTQFQIIYEVSRDFVSEEELGYENIEK